MLFNRDKFKALAHYICWKCDDPSTLGATKLNKTLWFSDLLTYLNLDAPITGARYVKLQFGPVPSAILPILSELQAEGAIATREVDFHNHTKREFWALKKPDLALFSAQEISIVDSVLEQICTRYTATTISDLTHNDAWEIAEIGEDLPLCTAFSARRGEITGRDVAWADSQIAALEAA